MSFYAPPEGDAGEGRSSNIHEYTVSELSGTLKRTVEEQFGHVRVRGELSGVKRAASGHIYLGLKDDQAVMDGVCWRGTAQRLSFVPEDGLEVICTGKLTTYPARSKYQLVIEHMEPAGAGALMALLEERKKKLSLEGLFDPERRKSIPFLPRVIGVVTSPTGAVIRDILHRLSDRFPRHVLVWPVLVQGEGAADQIAAAIRGFNALGKNSALPRPDVLIVARGGGSIEDLWCFNEEVVVRAVAESVIPLISAVGHETDTTLIDYASDRRAPTPTGAAEMAVPVREELIATVADYGRRLAGLRLRLVEDRRRHLDNLSRALPKPRDILALPRQRLDDLSGRLPGALRARLMVAENELRRRTGALVPGRLRDRTGYMKETLSSKARRLEPAVRRLIRDARQRYLASSRMLDSLSFERILDRGFALVTDNDGHAVKSSKGLRQGDALSLRFADGAVPALVAGQSIERSKPRVKPRTKVRVKQGKTGDGDQGSLF